MENNSNMLNLKLGFFNILKQTLIILYKHTNLLLSFLAFIPFLCFMVFHLMIIQTTLTAIAEILRQPPPYFSHWLTRGMAIDFSRKLFQLGLLHHLPLHLLELFAAVVTIDLTAKTYAKEKPITPKEMVQRLLNQARWKGILLTSAYVYLVSTCLLIGSTWLLTNYYIIMRNFFYNVFTAALYRVACVALLLKYLEWTAIWNMSIVISVLEEIYGAKALRLSASLFRGSERQGSLLMFVFFAWSIGLSFLCFYDGCNGNWRSIMLVSLICMGNVMKWVACVVYFNHRKEQNVQRVDEEEGNEVRSESYK